MTAAHAYMHADRHEKKRSFFTQRESAQGGTYNIALHEMQLQRFMGGNIFCRDECDARQLIVERERHQLKTEESTVMVLIFDYQPVVGDMVYGIFVMGKQVHEFFGRGAK